MILLLLFFHCLIIKHWFSSMSQNTEHYQLVTPSLSSSSNNNNNKQLPSHQHFSPTSSDFNSPSTIVSTTQNDSPSPSSRTVRYIKQRKRRNLYSAIAFFLHLLIKKRLYKRTNEKRINVYFISPFFHSSLFCLVADCQWCLHG
jgi:hypothetical protein